MHIMKIQMKKITAILSTVTYLASGGSVFAATNIEVSPPPYGYSDLGNFIFNLIKLAFIIAILIVLVMLVWGAIEWIVSGGEKEAVGKARGKIINALIGLAILAVAYAIAVLAGQFLGFGTLITPEGVTLPIPSPS